jgi:hypothetical protein
MLWRNPPERTTESVRLSIQLFDNPSDSKGLKLRRGLPERITGKLFAKSRDLKPSAVP